MGVVVTLLVLAGSKSVDSLELTAAVVAELVVEVVSSWFNVVVVVDVVSVGAVSQEDVDGIGISVGLERAG